MTTAEAWERHADAPEPIPSGVTVRYIPQPSGATYMAVTDRGDLYVPAGYYHVGRGDWRGWLRRRDGNDPYVRAKTERAMRRHLRRMTLNTCASIVPGCADAMAERLGLA